MSRRTGKALFDAWYADLTSDEPPEVWATGDGVSDHVEVAPGRIILLGGAPGAGKTAFILQWTFGMLAANPALRALVANVEMPPHALLTRQAARLSGIPLTRLRKRQVEPAELPRLGAAARAIRDLIDRLAFADDPHRLDAIATAASDFGADLIIADYVQRIEPAGKATGMRERINLLMSELRRIADAGNVGILAAAALTRSRDRSGKATYAGQHLSLGSFRESSELEYAADECLLLYPTDDDHAAPVRSMLLSHQKSRYGELRDVALSFDRRIQKFEVDPWAMPVSASPPPEGKVRAAGPGGES